MELFWGSLAPLTLLAALAASLVPALAAVLAGGATASDAAFIGALGFLAQLLLLLPLEYYLVRTRVHGPISRLEGELRGSLPWRPERDPLLGSLRRVLGDIRATALQAVEDASRQRDRLTELQARSDDRRTSEALADRLTEALRGADQLDAYIAAVAPVLREVWPFEHLRLLTRSAPDSGMEVVYAADAEPDEAPPAEGAQTGEGSNESTASPATARYRHASLPHPVKEALHRGFFCESGTPFTRDTSLPSARSFVALGLEHRGFAAGVLLLASSTLTPPSAEPLRQMRPLLSLAFSRALYVREMGEVAIRDSLTGAHTEQHFLSVLRQEVARSNRYGRPAACLLVDIDDLRRINDLHGLRGGDQVIVEVAQVVGRLLRSSDILARTSGGRLALLLPETEEDAAFTVADRIREHVQECAVVLLPSGQVERVTVSVGVASHPPHGVTALALFDAARGALRRAKASGKNRVACAAGGLEP